MDREKVIKGLEETEIMLKQAVDRGGEMAVMGAFKCCNHVSDAIALLKEQKGLMLALEQSNASNEYLNAEVERLTGLLKEQEAVNITTDFVDGFGNRTSHCPSCNSRLVWHQNKNYCGECGRAVKWE